MSAGEGFGVYQTKRIYSTEYRYS